MRQAPVCRALQRCAHQGCQDTVLLAPLQGAPQLLLRLVHVALARDDEAAQRSGLVTSHDQVVRQNPARGGSGETSVERNARVKRSHPMRFRSCSMSSLCCASICMVHTPATAEESADGYAGRAACKRGSTGDCLPLLHR